MAPLSATTTSSTHSPPSLNSPSSSLSSPTAAGADRDYPQSGDAADLFIFNDESAAALGIPTSSVSFPLPHGLVDDGCGSASKSNDAVPSSYYSTPNWAFSRTTPPCESLYDSPYDPPVAKFAGSHHHQHHNHHLQQQQQDHNHLQQQQQDVIFPDLGWELSTATLDTSLSPPIPSAAIAPSHAAAPLSHQPPPPPSRGPRRTSPLATAVARSASGSGHRSSSPPSQYPHLHTTHLPHSQPQPHHSQLHHSQPQAAFNFGTEALHILTPPQHDHMPNIAMPAHLEYHSPESEPSPVSSTSDTNVKLGGAVSSPEPSVSAQLAKANKKRKATTTDLDDEDDDDDDDIEHPVKKTAHNMIEKRYRNNLNDKIAALRDSVPSLRIMSKSARGEDTTEDREELHGLTPAHKLNKATILSKATEYIRHLEKRNARLIDENESMHSRISAFEKLVMAGAMPGVIGPAQPPTPIQYQAETMPYINTPLETPVRDNAVQGGMMPQSMQAQQFARPQQAFDPNAAMVRQQHLQKRQQQQQQNNRWVNAGPYFGKLMVGSLAGLMMLEAIRENEVSSETTEGRGLFALPIHLLRMVHSSMHVHFMGHHIAANTMIHYLKVLLFAGIFLWVFVPSLFMDSKSRSKPKAAASLEAAPSLASPIHVRRQAWLTAIQTVWVPHNNYVLEAAALGLKTLKLSLRNAIGVTRYQMLTGLTPEQEEARVQAWSIALDAQLAGGDGEINKSRLTLTLLASKTLPGTPQRLMMQALHIRVLLWELARLGFVNTVAAKLARTTWNEARQLHRLSAHLKKSSTQSEQSEEDLPDHLAALLEQECDIVLNDAIIQRAHNLAWNHATDRDVNTMIDGMNAVVDDTAVRSPLDAVAAWWCCQTVHNALMTSLEASAEDEEARQAIADNISVAIRAAPVGSGVLARALVARAVLVSKSRGASIAAALQALGPSRSNPTLAPYSSAAKPSGGSSSELRAALRGAMALAYLNRATTSGPAPPELRIVHFISVLGSSATSLLVCTATYHVVDKLFAHQDAAEIYSHDIERLSGGLRIWIGGPAGEKSGMPSDLRAMLVESCLDITKQIIGMEIDTGYGSGSEKYDERSPLSPQPQSVDALTS